MIPYIFPKHISLLCHSWSQILSYFSFCLSLFLLYFYFSLFNLFSVISLILSFLSLILSTLSLFISQVTVNIVLLFHGRRHFCLIYHELNWVFSPFQALSLLMSSANVTAISSHRMTSVWLSNLPNYCKSNHTIKGKEISVDTLPHHSSTKLLKKCRLGILRYFLRGIITAQLTSCLDGLDSAALFCKSYQNIYLFGWIQTSQTGGQPYGDTCLYEVSKYSLDVPR